MAAPKRTPTRPERKVRLKPKDSFDLIRLLARSQSDARKAIGELVQNSLDADAQHIVITWFNERGLRSLRVLDDGGGVFPELEREEALCKLAQTIGHSHKQDLSPAQRHEQMVLGKYGIGLLGFWSVARHFELKSRVGGGETWILQLEEDRPDAHVRRARSRSTADEPTFTEITLRGIKESVQRQVRPPRLQAYLAGELRGQLLQRSVEVRLYDRVSRGRAQKEFRVLPRAYLGRPIGELSVLGVTGHEDARIELYHVPADEGRQGVVTLACGGTTVLDDIALVDPTDPEGARREPWASGRFEGVIDFPDLEVAPGTRRGFVPNDAALEFLLALEKLEHELGALLATEAQQRAVQRREEVAKEIRRAFAPVARRLPQYDFFDVRLEAAGGRAEPPAGAGGAMPAGTELPLASTTDPAAPGDPTEEPEAGPLDPAPGLFPPGPLAAVTIHPKRLRLAPSSERTLRARGVDADDRPVPGAVEYLWDLVGEGELVLDPQSGARARFRAARDPGAATIEVLARQGELEARAELLVNVSEAAGAAGAAAGIPEPVPVDAPSELWRSRIRGARWEYNEGHRDYIAVVDDEARRVRYLIHLFAKEVVLRNFGGPQDEELLERMVEVLVHIGEGRGVRTR